MSQEEVSRSEMWRKALVRELSVSLSRGSSRHTRTTYTHTHTLSLPLSASSSTVSSHTGKQYGCSSTLRYLPCVLLCFFLWLATLRGFFDIRHPQLAADILFCEFDNPSRRRKLLTKHLRMFGFEEIVDSGVPAGVSRWHHKENNFTPTDPYLSIRLGTVPGVQCENMLQESVRPGSHCQAHHVVIFSQNLFEHDHQVRVPNSAVLFPLLDSSVVSFSAFLCAFFSWVKILVDGSFSVTL